MDQRQSDFRPPRLSAAMASQKLLVLEFVRDYIARWGGSPSHGEIGAGLDIHRSRVRRALRSLVRDGLLLRTPGPRGLAIPDAEAEAIRQLRATGWTIDAAGRRVIKATLQPPPALDYAGPGSEGAVNDGATEARTEGA